MKAVIQRVSSAAVTVSGETVGKINKGLLVLLGVAKSDTPELAEKLASKVARMRIFDDENGKLSKSVSDVDGGILIVSNFTLCSDCSRGNRPDFGTAAGAEQARELYLHFIDSVINSGIKNCESGRFGADMQISLVCDGPVTIALDTDSLK
jgi:D-tyrosyl-tRNA(Tyr) deacylase